MNNLSSPFEKNLIQSIKQKDIALIQSIFERKKRRLRHRDLGDMLNENELMEEIGSYKINRRKRKKNDEIVLSQKKE